MRSRFRSSRWPNGCISIGLPARRSRCRTTSYTPSGSRYTTIRIFVGSSISCARSWTVSARRTQICAATSFLALSRSNSPFSTPPIRPEFFLRNLRHRSGGISGTSEFIGCNRSWGQGGDRRVRGTDGSNPPSSRGESVSAVHREAAREESRASRDSERRWGRETGWADRNPALSGAFSLTGIDAVPPWGSADQVQRRAGRGDNRGWGHLQLCGLGSEKPVLLGPVERQIEFGQTRGSKLGRLPAVQDRLDQLWAQEGQTNKTTDVAPADAVAFGQLLQRSHAAGDQLVKPHPSACNRLDQRRIASRRMVVLCVEQHKPGPDTAPLDSDGRGQLDSAVAGCIRFR